MDSVLHMCFRTAGDSSDAGATCLVSVGLDWEVRALLVLKACQRGTVFLGWNCIWAGLQRYSGLYCIVKKEAERV